MSSRWRRAQPVSVDEAFYGGNLSDVIASRFAAANNRLGATGADEIRRVQTALNSLPSNLPRLVVDGLVGPKTRERVTEYQRREGLPVNGDPSDVQMKIRLFNLGTFPNSSPSAPPPMAASDYYVKGTPFLWLVPVVETGFAFAIDPFQDARNALASALAANGYSVRVVALRGGALEVSGSQNIDRGSITHVRDQITNAARAAGFLWSMPVQFNVERAGSPFRVGSPGATQTYGDKTPVAPKDALTEFGINPFSNDPNSKRNLPDLSGGTGTIILLAVVGLVAAKILRR